MIRVNLLPQKRRKASSSRGELWLVASLLTVALEIVGCLVLYGQKQDELVQQKDKNKAHPWITQFVDMSLASVSDKDWKVKKDGGRLDYHAGATVTPRAVSKAVLKAVKWAAANREQLFAESATPAGAAK